MQNDKNPLEGILTRNTGDPRKNPEGYMDLTPYNAMKLADYPKRGCIYCMDDKEVLVVTYDENNMHSNTVGLVFIFPDVRPCPLSTHIQVGEKTVRCERIVSYPRSRIGKKIGQMSDEDMQRIEAGLLIGLGIKEKPVQEAPASPIDPVAGSEMIVLETQRDLYKKLYEQLLARITRDKVQGGGLGG